MRNKCLYVFLFIFMFCFSISGVKADNFCYQFGSNSEKIDVSITGGITNDFNLTSVDCKINVEDSSVDYTSCLYIGTGTDGRNYNFVEPKSIKVSNSKGDNNALRMTSFKAVCKRSNDSVLGNSYTCKIEKMLFKWEKHDKCNNPDRSCNNNGIPGAIACIGGSSIFCDKYKNMKNSEIKSECPGAYGDDNNLKKKDILKKCETMDSVAFDSWCKYGKNGGTTRNYEAVPDITGYNYEEKKYGVGKAITCSKLLGPDNVKLIHTYLLYICIAGVLLVVVLGAMDFVKAIASSDDDGLKTAWKRIKNRIISVIILLLLPALVNFILSFVDDNFHLETVKDGKVKKSDISVKIGKASDCGL